MTTRRSFIRGLVRVAPIIVVPDVALEAVGRSMVGWGRELEPQRGGLYGPWDDSEGPVFYGGAADGGKTDAFVGYMHVHVEAMFERVLREQERMRLYHA